MRAFRAFLRDIVDFAGLFPPAGLDMPSAVRAYAGYRSSQAAWMLGRFVVPASRLDEFATAFSPDTAGPGPWHLAATGSEDVTGDFDAIRTFNRHAEARPEPVCLVDSYEGRVAAPEGVAALGREAGSRLRVACEIPADFASGPGLPSILDAIKSAGAVAKLRTGGLSPDAIPPSACVAQFIWQCSLAGVPMKATAGLHHPVRSSQRLTYRADSPVAVVHGFMNVFVAAALASTLRGTLSDAEGLATLTAVLDEDDPAIFTFDDEKLGWRGHHLTVATIEAARSGAALSFGSCSFDEPISDLRRLGFHP